MFVALLESDQSRVEAANAIRKLRHICPHCFELVILHSKKVKRPHFKHRKDAECPYRQSESWQHEHAKAAILAGARAKGLIAEPECEVLSIDGDRRADVIILAPSTDLTKNEMQRRRAFEVQYSAISYCDLMKRTHAYMAASLPLLWVAVIDDGKFKTLHRVNGTNLVCVSGYSVPSWVEDIAHLHRRLWIYVPQSNGFWRAWLLPHWCYKNPTDSFHDSYGEYHSGSSGNWYQAAKKRDLYLDGPYSFGSLKVATGKHSDNPLIAPNREKRWLVELLPDGFETELDPPIEQKRCPHLHNGKDTGFYTYVEWHKFNGSDAKATFSLLGQFPKLERYV